MPSISLPQNRRWKGILPGKDEGSLWQTWNIDLERVRGRASLADKSRILVDSDTDIASMGVPLKFIRTNPRDTESWYAMTTTKILKNNNTSPTGGTWISDSDVASSPSNPRDMAVHEGFDGDSDGIREDRLVISLDTNIAILNVSNNPLAWRTTWWTDTTTGGLSQASLTAGVPHPLIKHERLLFVGNRDSDGVGVVNTIDRTDVVVAPAFRFKRGIVPRLFLSTSNRVWACCHNEFGGNGFVFECNPSKTNYEGEHELMGTYPLTGWVHNDIPYVVTELGFIMKFTGGGFKPAKEFPLVEEKLEFTARAFTAGAATTTPADSITEYASYVDGNIVKILIGAPITSRRMRSGLWIYDIENDNLYHQIGVGQHKSADSDLDYGQAVLAGVGGITQTKARSTEFLAGASVYTNYASASKSVLTRLILNSSRGSNAGRNRGYIITPWVSLPEMSTYWQGMWIKFRKFISNSNSIVLKHRVNESRIDQNDNDESVTQSSGNWRNDTSFVSAIPTGVVVGDEVEVLSGRNAGSCFHITTITDTASGALTPNGSTNAIVSINEAVGTANDTGGALFRFENWVNDSSISDTTSYSEFLPLISGDSNFNNVSDAIQFKLELRGFSNEIKELLPTYREGQSVD